MTTVGVAETYTDEIGDMGLILRIDGGTTHVNPCGKVFEQVYSGFSVDDCNRVGSDGVIAMQFTQMDEEVSYLKRCTRYYYECKKYGQVLFWKQYLVDLVILSMLQSKMSVLL